MLSLEDYAKLEEAWEYQDFITQKLVKIGISVNAYQSKTYQMKYGESASGIEIKNDRKMKETNNIYIEFNQITLRGSHKDSGVCQKDDSWLYVIGDYEKFYIFSKKQLFSLVEKVKAKKKYWYERYNISIKSHRDEYGNITSTGIVIPLEYIENNNLALRKVEIKDD